MSDTIDFSCHCRAVKLSVKELPDHFMQCNCSTCGRYGAKWAYYEAERVVTDFDPNHISSYQWGDKECEFFHCVKCGCMTHYEATDKKPKYRIAINGRMLVDRNLMDSMPSKYFDGRDSWEMLTKAFP